MGKKLKLDELVSDIGNENITMQNLDECAVELSRSNNNVTKITFLTDMPFDMRGTERLGVVLWFERDAVRKWLDAFKARTDEGDAS